MQRLLVFSALSHADNAPDNWQPLLYGLMLNLNNAVQQLASAFINRLLISMHRAAIDAYAATQMPSR